MSAPAMTEQVEYLIEWAATEARKTGTRQRIVAIRSPRGVWYYLAGNTQFPSRHRRTAS